MERPQNLRLLIIAIAILLPSFVLAQSVGISDNPITPDPQSILELKTTTKGVLLPRLNTGEIATLTGSPLALSDKGLTVFNTSTNRYNVWDGSQWIVLAASTPGTGDFIINDVAQQTGADFNIDGNGTMADLAITGGDITSSGLLRIGSTTDVRIRLDTDANGSEEFQITNNGGTTPVFTVTEAGNLDAKGSGTFEGDLNLIGAGRTLAAETNFDITGESGIDIIIDSDNNSTNTSFRIQKDASTDLLEIQEDGDMIVPGLFGTGSNLIQANGTGQLSRSSIDPTDLITGTGSPTQLAYFDATQNIVSDADLFWDPTNKRLGLGTVSPNQTLDVDGKALFRNGGNNNSLTGTQLLFGWAGGNSYKHAIKTRHQSASDAENAIDFYVWDFGTDAQLDEPTKRVMSIEGTDQGRVGIGTGSPYAGLHVSTAEGAGSGYLGVAIGGGASGNSKIEIRGGSTPYIDFSNDSGSDYDGRFRLLTDDRIIVEGANFGIGISPEEALHVSGNARFSSLSAGGNVQADGNGNLIISNDIPNNDTGYIWNQTGTDQSASFQINGTGIVGANSGGIGSSTFKVARSATDFADVRFSGSGMGQLEIVGWSSGWNLNAMTNGKHLYLNRDAGANSDIYLGRNGQETIIDGTNGNVTVSSLTGTGTRQVYATASGVLQTKEVNSTFALSSNLMYSPDDLWGHGGSGTGTLSGDDVTSTQTMPFSLTMEGTSYNQLTISTNGWVSFGNPGSSQLSNECIPDDDFNDPTIMAYWDDLVTEGSNIRYGYVGTSPNRTYVIDYECRTYSGSYSVRFQIQIHESSGLLNVQYRNPMHANANGQSATIGFQGAGGSSSNAYSITCNGKVLDDNRDDRMGWSIAPVR